MISISLGRSFRQFALCGILLWSLQACTEAGGNVDLPAAFIRVDIDKSDPKRLLNYYFGGYVTPEPRDPFEAGLLADTAGALYVNIDSLDSHYPGAAAILVDGDGNNRISWEELEEFIDATYYKARRLPFTLDSLLEVAGYTDQNPGWMQIDVDGVMSSARRRIFVQETSVREALAGYWENEEKVIYPNGTTIIGKHFLKDSLAETTVMRKRQDGFWDFAVYGAGDTLAPTTLTPPRELKAPVQCVGCHFGSKLFEPEKSFPLKSDPGPHGPRQLYVEDAVRDADVVKLLDEHRKRSDTILGLYSTLFVAELRQQQRDGTIAAEDSVLIRHLGL